MPFSPLSRCAVIVTVAAMSLAVTQSVSTAAEDAGSPTLASGSFRGTHWTPPPRPTKTQQATSTATKPDHLDTKVSNIRGGDPAMSMTAVADALGTPITFSEYPLYTYISDQYAAQGILFAGESAVPQIVTDGANPTSPVLEGGPGYVGDIRGSFVVPGTHTPASVDEFSLDVGYIDDPQSTELYVFGARGQLLGTILATNYGIVHMTSTFAGATYWIMHSDFSDGAGWAIDNVALGSETAAAGAPLPAIGLGGGMNSRYNPTCNTGQPVNCASGNFWHTFNDVTIPGRGPGLMLSRTYNSLNADRDSIFGPGWSSTYDAHLVANTDGSLTVVFPDGSRVDAQPDPITGQYVVPAFADATLVHDGSGWAWTSRLTGVTAHFDANGFLVAQSDRNGNSTTIVRSASGVPQTVTDAAGRTLTFTSDAQGHVTRVVDPSGRTFDYTYDASGELTRAADPAGSGWAFGYGTGHLLVSMTDPDGDSLTNVYDGGGRVTSQTDYANRTTAFDYTGDAFSSGGGTTTITDPRGDITRQQYAGGLLESLTRGYGTPAAATWTYGFDPATFAPTHVTDPNGNSVTNTFDFDGNRLTSTDGTGVQRTATYNQFDEVTTSTDGTGWTSYLYYDGFGNLTDEYRPLDTNGDYAHTQIAHGDSAHPGDVTSVVDADQHTWTYAYSTAGDLVKVSDPDGHATSATYDALSRRTSVATPRGGQTSFWYDVRSELVQVTDATGGVTRTTFDANGNATSVTDADGHATSTAYDADNEAVKVTKADGTTISYGYDASGNRTSQTDGAGHKTTWTFDALDRATGASDPLGRTTAYGYDGAGNQVSTTDASGRATTFGFDANSQLTSVNYSDPATHDIAFTYDANRRRTSMADATGTSTYTYDVGNRLLTSTNGAGATVDYQWDAADQMTAVGDASHTVQRAYDAEGRLSAVTDWNGKQTTFGYDADGHLSTETYPNGVSTSITNDLGGAVTGITDTNGATTLGSFGYTRDASRQVTGETSTGAGQTAQTYTYNPLDQLASRNGATIGYNASGDVLDTAAGRVQYDAADQITTLTPATGPVVTFSYDQEGQRLTGATADGTGTRYSYDQAGRLTEAATTTGGSTSPLGLLGGGVAHSLALANGNDVYAWGANESGELGDGTQTTHKTAEKVLSGASAVAAGAQFSLALMDNGTVDSWGDNSTLQLGVSGVARRLTPAAIAGLSGVTQVAAGNYHALAVQADGTVKAWGLNSAGELGDGTTKSASTPVTAKGLTGVTQVAAGGLPGWAGHSVALSGGQVWAWGYGKSGQLGGGTVGTSGTPTKVVGLSGVTQVAAGGDNTYALKSDGTVWAWGDNSFGQIGNPAAGKSQATPLKVTGLSNVVRIGAGGVMAFAVTADGSVWGWGDDNTGQLGDGGACGKTCNHPVRVGSLSTGVVAIGGYVHGLAALQDGTAKAWGSNTSGQVGDGTTTVRLSPVTVTGLSGITSAGGGTVRVQYTYDGDGLRSTSVAGAATTRYTWDVGSPTPMLLNDDAWNYVYGPGDRPVEQVANDGTTQFLHGDQVGTTRLVTDGSGAVVATFSYSPFGATEAKSGAADTRLRFAGQYQDAATGLYFLRSRYFDPATSQFLTRDPMEVLTHSAYGYAGQNPLTFVDPMGLDWWNPFSWSGKTWAAVGTGVAIVGLTVATAGVGDVVVLGGVAVTEVTADVVVSEVGIDATFTAASYVEGGLTAEEVVTGAGRLVAAGATLRGGYDTYNCINDGGPALACGMDAGATILSAFDPFLGLDPLGELAYSLFGMDWSLLTPEERAQVEAAACAQG